MTLQLEAVLLPFLHLLAYRAWEATLDRFRTSATTNTTEEESLVSHCSFQGGGDENEFGAGKLPDA